MKKYNILILIMCLFTFIGCVQESSKKTITVKLHVEGFKNIQKVGIRGNENPLSWDYDLELEPIVNDSLYAATFSMITGYKFTEVKFTVNGEFELNENENRRIIFGDKDTTTFEVKFNVVNE